MTKKLWFQAGVGILLTLLIFKLFIEIKHIFYPIAVILGAIFIPLLIGGILFYITEPLQRYLEKHKFKRWMSILTILVGLIAILAAFVSFIWPLITSQLVNFIEGFPAFINEITKAIQYFFDHRDNLPDQVQGAIDNALDSIKDYAVLTSKFLVDVVSAIVSGAFVLILIPFFFIYMLKDHEKFAPRIYNLFLGRRREWVKKTLTDVNEVLKNYVQGQLLISFFLASMMFIGYLIIGLDYALLLVIFAFFMNIIPFIGPWIAFIPALILGFLDSPMTALWVCVVTLVAQQIDSNFITPNVMGKTLDIHPLTVITIILAAGNIAGFFGVLLGVPFYAVVKVIVKNVYARRLEIKQAATKEV
ncbi:MAG: AI-2E family transporter [Kurthia sp.]|nr:AI-2E family transporter [Candidatus Kurthia equi]